MADVIVTDALIIPEAELSESFAKSGGPGGQHVNKTETKVELRWSVSGSRVIGERDRDWLLKRLGGKEEFVVVASDERSQSRNRAEARRRLAAAVREALKRPVRRKPTRPSKGSVERRLAEKRRRGERKAQRTSTDDD